MTKHFFTIIILFGLLSCDPKTDKIERPGEPEMYKLEGDDKEMNDAKKKAKNSIHDFTTAFQSDNSALSMFFVKIGFDSPNAIEHIWVKVISADNNKLRGIIDNLPNNTTIVKLGDTINIDNGQISDWMYSDTVKHKIYGAQTIRVLRNRMTTDEKKQLDSELGGTLE